MSFILPDQNNWNIETNGLNFGASVVVSKALKLDQSVVTASPTVTAVLVGTYSTAPFVVSVTPGTPTSCPTINLTLSSPISAITLGQTYQITITANSVTDTLYVTFLFTDNFNESVWTNSNEEDNAIGYFKFNPIATGYGITSAFVNTKFKMIMEYLTLLNSKVSSIFTNYKIKKNLPDIINSAIFAGVIPSGYNGTVTHNSDGTINTILLQDTVNVDADSYCLLTFNYTSLTKIITVGGTPNTSTYQGLSSISIDRVNSSSVKMYNIATVTINRSSTPTVVTSLISVSVSVCPLARIFSATAIILISSIALLHSKQIL